MLLTGTRSHRHRDSLQEVDLSADAMIRYTAARQTAWQDTLSQAFASKDEAALQLIGAKQLVGLLLLVYARSPDHIGACEMSTVATGNLGFANKGAVACHLRCATVTGAIRI